MSKRLKSTTKKAGANSSMKRKHGSRPAKDVTRAFTTTQSGPENTDTCYTDETLSEGPTWADIAIPCRCLIRENNVEGITDNPIIEAWFRESSINGEMLCEEDMGWINTAHYELVEYMGPLENEEEINHE